MKPSRMSANRRTKYAGTHTFSIYMDVDIEEMFDEMSDDLLAAVRPAAQAMSEVLYRAVKQNVAAIGSKSGNLAGAIYQRFSEEGSRQAGAGYERATYHVSWRTAKGTGLPRAPHGHWLEYGYWRRYPTYVGSDGNWYTNKKAPLATPVYVPARPFIRPASAHYQEAYDAGMKVLFDAVGAR